MNFVAAISEITELNSNRINEQPRYRIATGGSEYEFIGGFIDTNISWFNVLEILKSLNLPLFFVTDPRNRTIKEILVPRLVKVISIKAGQYTDFVEVELFPSHARHFLWKQDSSFEKFISLLEEAQHENAEVYITERIDGSGIIIDVTPSDKTISTGNFVRSADNDISISSISLEDANKLFNTISNCCACTIPLDPLKRCIPFNFPDNGCWARAHETCRLILEQGITPRKLWIYGNLYISSKNHPLCNLWWIAHVAAAVNVKQNGIDELYVIDPSIFPERIVPKDEWVKALSNTQVKLIETSWEVYFRKSDTSFIVDSDFSKTNRDLEIFRAMLMLRSARSFGKEPPYGHCALGLQLIKI